MIWYVDAVAPETVVGLRLLCPLLSIKASKIDPDNVCRKIIVSSCMHVCMPATLLYMNPIGKPDSGGMPV